MMFNSPRRLAVAALVFVAGLLTTFIFTTAHKSLEYQAWRAEYKYETSLRHKREVDDLQQVISGLSLEVEKMRGQLAGCQGGVNGNVVPNNKQRRKR